MLCVRSVCMRYSNVRSSQNNGRGKAAAAKKNNKNIPIAHIVSNEMKLVYGWQLPRMEGLL